MTGTGQKRNIPQLRFPEFKGEWEEKKLKDVSTYFNGGSFENDVREEGKYELITLKSVDTGGNLVHSKRFIDIEVPTLSKDTLVMILSEQAPGLLGMTALIPTDNKYVLNQRVAEIRPNDKVESYFLSMAINRNQRYFSKLGAGTKVQNITKPNVENYAFLCPTPPEQTKIANFLTAVDKRINLLQKKKAELEQYKKGVMQRIFVLNYDSKNVLNHDSKDLHDDHDLRNQEIKNQGNQEHQAKSRFRLRFKQDDGSDFPGWEEKKLGEIAEINMGQSPSSSSYNVNGIGKYLIQGNADITNRQTSPRNWTSKPTKLCDIDDIIMTVRAPVGSIAKSKHNACIGRGVCSIKNNSKSDIEFLYQLLLSYEEKWVSLEQGSTFTAVSGKDIRSIKFFFPISVEEQQKIANFLSSIDKSIEKLGKQIEQSQEWKKGLLQKMFV